MNKEEIENLSDELLIENLIEEAWDAGSYCRDIENGAEFKQELLSRLSKENWKKGLIENIEKEIPDDWTYHDGITIKNVVKGIINNLK